MFFFLKLLILRASSEAKPEESESESEIEEGGDYVVYECPGLAPVLLNFKISFLYDFNSLRII